MPLSEPLKELKANKENKMNSLQSPLFPIENIYYVETIQVNV